jgi:RNA polymerase sigma-70 factor (ECF subfamily)
MLEMEERSILEVSELTGWSATVIRVRAFRARRRLNKRFAELRKEKQL